MQIITILTTLALAATALAACPNGPYAEGAECAGACVGAQRCSKNTDHVVRTAIYLLLPTSYRLLVFYFITSLSRHVLLTLYILYAFVSKTSNGGSVSNVSRICREHLISNNIFDLDQMPKRQVGVCERLLSCKLQIWKLLVLEKHAGK